MRRLRFSLPKDLSDVDVLLKFFGVPSPERWLTEWERRPGRVSPNNGV